MSTENKFTTMKEAVDFVYESYMKAQPYLLYQETDSNKRNPDYTKDILQQRDKGNHILVTGSKGKGSVARMLSKIFQSAKKDVGMFTSPHVISFCDRIQRNDANISEEDFIACCNEIREEIESIPLHRGAYVSPIGIQCAIALQFFEKHPVDIKVIECGKGVRYDDTRNLSRSYGVINPIFLEHTRELGETLALIANDKADIIMPGMKAVYVAEQTEEVFEILEKRAEVCKVELRCYGKDFWCENIRYTSDGMKFNVVTSQHTYVDISIPLLGGFQAKNCALALALAEEVVGTLSEERVRKQLSSLKYPGRMEIISRDPLTILDACIHPQAALQVKEVLAHMIRPYGAYKPKIAAVIAIPMDKDYIGTVKELADMVDVILLSKSKNPHYHFSKEQAALIQQSGIACKFVDDLAEAQKQAEATGAEIVCLLGTTSMITEVLTNKNH